MPLEYSSARSSPLPRIIRYALLAAIAVVGASGLLLPTFSVRDTRMDAVTGSIQTTTTRLGHASVAVIASPLASRLTSTGADLAYSPNWQLIGSTGSNILGITTWRACGRAPALISYRNVLDLFAAQATDDQLRDYLQVMQSGTQQQQDELLSEMADRYLNATPAPPAH